MNDYFVGRRKRRMVKAILALTVVLFITGGIYYFLETFSIKHIEVAGSTHYEEQEIIDMVIKEPLDRISLILSWKYNNKPITDIAFIQSIEVTVPSSDSVHIQVYEKALAGYIEYLGEYMYFDKDGIVVEASGQHTQDVPQITGLKFQSVVLHNPLPVESPEVFAQVLEIANLLHKYELDVDKIYFNQNLEVTLHMGPVRVALGDKDKLIEKMMKLRDIAPHLTGLSGVLHLEHADSSTDEIIFTKDTTGTQAE